MAPQNKQPDALAELAVDFSELPRAQTPLAADAGKELSPADCAYHAYTEIFPLVEGEAFDALCEDIRQNGQRQAIVTHDGLILDGRNRHRACLAVGIAPHFVEYVGDDDPDALLGFVVSANVHRRHLDISQRVMIAAKIASMRSGTRTDLASWDARSDAQAAQLLHIGEASVERAKTVRPKGVPELQQAVEAGEAGLTVAAAIARRPVAEQQAILTKVAQSPDGKRAFRAVAKELRAEEQARKRDLRSKREEELGARQRALPEGQYEVLLADPPWPFEAYSETTGMDRAPDYPTMTVEAIAALPVQSIAAEDSVLFMWATAAMVPEALAVMEAWGFAAFDTPYTRALERLLGEVLEGGSAPEQLAHRAKALLANRAQCGRYASSAVWVKDRCGTGYWFRSRHELLLIGVRGNIPAPSLGLQLDSVQTSVAAAHSAKPEWQDKLIETLLKVELFARGRPRAGWVAWGNEVVPKAAELSAGQCGSAAEGLASPAP